MQSRMPGKIFVYLTYMGIAKFVLIKIDWKIANLAKANIEVH